MFRTSTNSISSSIIIYNRRYVRALVSSYRHITSKEVSTLSFQRIKFYHSSVGRHAVSKWPLLNVDSTLEPSFVSVNDDLELDQGRLKPSENVVESGSSGEGEIDSRVSYSSEEAPDMDPESSESSQEAPAATLEILNLIPSTRKSQLRRLCAPAGPIDELSFRMSP
jgi:hypothetical protein